MSQSSINKRANGTSWHGNELGNRHGGPAPRNRNNLSRLNSNSKRTHATSPGPEPRTDDHNRGPANARASDGQQPGNRSNTERDRPGDSETCKRKLNEVIAEALFSSSKKIRSEYVFFFFFFTIYCHTFLHRKSLNIHKLRTRARGIHRFIGPFIHIQSIVIN